VQLPIAVEWARAQTESTYLGIPVADTQPLLQADAFKELVNKLAWTLGSTYRVSYNNARTPARLLAIALAKLVVADSGYPAQIGYPKE